jgi:hypothetical protein
MSNSEIATVREKVGVVFDGGKQRRNSLLLFQPTYYNRTLLRMRIRRKVPHQKEIF